MTLTTLEKLKEQCRIDVDNRAEDALLQTYAEAAEGVVLAYTGRDVRDLLDRYGTIPPALETAVLLIAADMYANREAGRVTSIAAVGPGVSYLINPYRRIL